MRQHCDRLSTCLGSTSPLVQCELLKAADQSPVNDTVQAQKSAVVLVLFLALGVVITLLVDDEHNVRLSLPSPMASSGPLLSCSPLLYLQVTSMLSSLLADHNHSHSYLVPQLTGWTLHNGGAVFPPFSGLHWLLTSILLLFPLLVSPCSSWGEFTGVFIVGLWPINSKAQWSYGMSSSTGISIWLLLIPG